MSSLLVKNLSKSTKNNDTHNFGILFCELAVANLIQSCELCSLNIFTFLLKMSIGV